MTTHPIGDGGSAPGAEHHDELDDAWLDDLLRATPPATRSSREGRRIYPTRANLALDGLVLRALREIGRDATVAEIAERVRAHDATVRNGRSLSRCLMRLRDEGRVVRTWTMDACRWRIFSV